MTRYVPRLLPSCCCLWLFCVACLCAQTAEPDTSAIARPPMVDLGAIMRSVVYPEIARRTGREGRVEIRVLVDTSGTPVQYEILHSAEPVLEQPALEAVMKARFTPAIDTGGKAVPVWVTIPIEFSLRSDYNSYLQTTRRVPERQPPISPYAGLVAALTRRIDSEPDSAALLLYRRGLVHHYIGDTVRATVDYIAALRHNGDAGLLPYRQTGMRELLAIDVGVDDAPALTGHGLLVLQHSPEDALQLCSLAVHADPTYIPAYHGRALALQRTGRRAEAIADLEVVLDENDENADALALLGRLHYEQRNYADALRFTEKALAVAPERASAAYTYALAALCSASPDDTSPAALFRAAYERHTDERDRQATIAELRMLVYKNIRAEQAQRILEEVFHTR